MEKAFIDDLYEIDIVVPGIIDDGGNEEGIRLVQRLVDFACKIERFIASGDETFLA